MGALAGLVALAAAAPARPMVDPAAVKAARDLILAAPEFNVASDWKSRFLDWLIRVLESAGAWLPGWLRICALVLLLGALAGLVWWLMPSAATEGDGAGPGPDATARRPDSWQAHHAAARTALAEGRLADCVRAAWNGAVVLLDRAGISRGGSGRADWEHVEAARRSRIDLAAPLITLVTAFQRSHFGARPLAHDEAQACLDLLVGLERSLGGHG